ncbi:hypothetical protein SNOG_08811 [Parastagonospora nodorum SN15]|uniref:NmrA-like domain-containing protein n=1 Tax=Phaeosphaeria nodorum (strain SN15 / ATCC MYA-4574 / FGSC 10173) TaxID=321614 RepID=Q0UHF3_PHANO|nr:hypothetical protein SNOG_08811 [Parastagonospora nodorum SN15]EAT83979.2 hypothetical protein SNOG_08811 [Parastagonospora nodorum SN15]
MFVQCDVKSYASQANLFQTVWTKWARLDVLIANAGCVDRDSKYNFHRRNTSVEDLPAEPNTECTDIDLKGTIYGTTLATHFVRHNPRGKGGKILVTGSMVGIYPCQTFPEYCAAKAAVHQWVKTMGPITKLKENITINCIMPGGMDTPAMPDFNDAFLPDQMTTWETLFTGFDLFLDDHANVKTGQTAEAAHDTIIEWGHPPYKSGAFAKRTEAVFEPWFKAMHSEKSDLPGAITDYPNHGDKIIAVTGATGSQGGGVVNVMKKTPGWKVRAITRNPGSDAAKKLAAEGIEVVQADFDDEASLAKAFKGVHAIFAVTNWWEHLFRGKTQDEAGVVEEEQGMKLARAASLIPTLTHYIFSTTPSPKRMFKGKMRAPHMDCKANIDNMAFFPLCKPFEIPGTGQYIQTMPTNPHAKVLLSGDMTVNPGIWVRQSILSGSKAHGKYANVALEKWSFQEMVDVWSEVTGKRCVFTEISTMRQS